MKIRRYFAEDMRQAIRKVREAQGPDAVILSNRKVDGGIEVVAAVDYDEALLWHEDKAPRAEDAAESPSLEQAPARQESAGRETAAAAVEWSQDPSISALREEVHSIRDMLQNQLAALAWGDLGRRRPSRAALLRRLLQMDLSPELARRVAVETGEEDGDASRQWKRALALIAQRIRTSGDSLVDRGGVAALIGPTGVGKTTTVAKLAARYALANGPDQVGLITMDTHRVGAAEQLRSYGRLMGIPVRVARNREELETAINDLYERRLVLIDTAGMGQRDARVRDQLAAHFEGLGMVQTLMVLAASSQLAALRESVKAFGVAHPEACIVTKLDEAVSLGPVISTLAEYQLPVAYFSDGQRVPEDIQPARAHNLVTRAVVRMKQSLPAFSDEMAELAMAGGTVDGRA
ncbi:MAG: flagellar biosynthesis protein FlhF [Gammaproteobacteria bacterium]|nr:flagellar biosynthesis protein FlhF [Gammaproteobacteria bacterium]